MNDREHFYICGREIRSVRNHWAFSLADFGDQFRVGASTVQAWERNGVSARNQKFDHQLFSVLRLSRDTLDPTTTTQGDPE